MNFLPETAGKPAPALPKIPETLNILPSSHHVLFPFMILPVEVSAKHLKDMIEEVVSGERILGVFATGGPASEQNGEGLRTIGTAAIILRMFHAPNGALQILIQGIKRVRLKQIVKAEPFISATVEEVVESLKPSLEFEAMMRNAISQFREIVQLAPYLPPEFSSILDTLEEPRAQIDFMSSNLNLKMEEQQRLLETFDVAARLKLLLGFLDRELEILKVGSKIHEEIHESLNKAQREAYLRQQLEAIKKELGETDEQTAVQQELRQRVREAKLPPEVEKEVTRELDRMAQIPQISPEYNVARTYVDWILALPWHTTTEDILDIEKARAVLDEDHFDLDKLKDRIIDYLAVRKLKQDMKGPILCFVGPPGTGKTSVGKSIARALGRKFIRMSLGGIRDEAEIRGHRRTYIGAMPGRIVQSIRRAGSKNPVIMLDEIDKVGADYRGDPSSALLEVLDPEQNNTFVDHYIDLPFDLSNVLFIATANVTDTIPGPLLDRMEILELPGYTEYDKIEISRRFLVQKQLAEHGVPAKSVIFEKQALEKIIRNYAREAGVRTLERSIAALCRKAARRIAGGEKTPIRITPAFVREILGPERFTFDLAEEKDEVGVVIGLAWTPTGGDILFIEAAAVPGTGQLRLTGRLGEVMQESAEAAMTYVRSRAEALGLPADFHSKLDVHLHIPEGAVPKDGPSAGVTMTTALASALTKRPARHNLAMTGEITLRGKVLPVGGIRDKMLAAHRSGIRDLILPKENERDLDELPPRVRRQLKFHFVTHLDEVLEMALRKRQKPSSRHLESTAQSAKLAAKAPQK